MAVPALRVPLRIEAHRPRRRLRVRDRSQPFRALRFAIQGPRNLWLKGSDLSVEVGLSEGFRVDVNDGVALTGEVSVKRGRIGVT